MIIKKDLIHHLSNIIYWGVHMKKTLLPILILFFSLLYIFIIPSNPELIKLIFKVIPMILIIIYAFKNIPSPKNKTHTLIIIGLIFSTIGDATLRWFVVGLTAFLISHLFYIGAFKRVASFNLPKSLSLIALIPVGIWMGIKLVQSLTSQDESFLIIPVLLYIVIILTMCFVAILTGNAFAIIGSILFVISDSILAWNMFVSSISFSGVYVMITYYSAQFFIATSMATISQKQKS